MSSPLLELVGSLAAIVAGWIANKYVIPFLTVGRRQRYASLIATLADEITDELREIYPGSAWMEHLDEAVDKLIAVLGIDAEIARRAIRAAAGRKKAAVMSTP